MLKYYNTKIVAFIYFVRLSDKPIHYTNIIINDYESITYSKKTEHAHYL